jgi:hypothetical protein
MLSSSPTEPRGASFEPHGALQPAGRPGPSTFKEGVQSAAAARLGAACRGWRVADASAGVRHLEIMPTFRPIRRPKLPPMDAPGSPRRSRFRGRDTPSLSDLGGILLCMGLFFTNENGPLPSAATSPSQLTSTRIPRPPTRVAPLLRTARVVPASSAGCVTRCVTSSPARNIAGPAAAGSSWWASEARPR